MLDFKDRHECRPDLANILFRVECRVPQFRGCRVEQPRRSGQFSINVRQDRTDPLFHVNSAPAVERSTGRATARPVHTISFYAQSADRVESLFTQPVQKTLRIVGTDFEYRLGNSRATRGSRNGR